MATLSATSAHHRGRIAGLARAVRNGERPVDDPELACAKRDYAAARIADYINKTLADAPPLTGEQRTALAELLKPVRRAGGVK
jgi:hypothetical protein